MRSYDSATLVKTPATRSRFSPSVTVSKPKCVGREGSGIAYSGVVVEAVVGFGAQEGSEVEKGRANRICCSGCATALRTAGSALLRADRAAIVAAPGPRPGGEDIRSGSAHGCIFWIAKIGSARHMRAVAGAVASQPCLWGCVGHGGGYSRLRMASVALSLPVGNTQHTTPTPRLGGWTSYVPNY